MKKYTLLISVFIYTTCYGQEYRRYFDSLRQSNDRNMFVRGYTKSIDSAKFQLSNGHIYFLTSSQEEHYNLSDSVWLSHDTTMIFFRYYSKLKKTKRDIEFERHFSNY